MKNIEKVKSVSQQISDLEDFIRHQEKMSDKDKRKSPKSLKLAYEKLEKLKKLKNNL